MKNYAVESCTVSDLNASELAHCLRLVVDGGAVNAKTTARDFPKSSMIALARNNGEVVGVASIKPIRENYTKGIARKAKFIFDPKTPELGYVVIELAHRGHQISSRMAAALAKGSGGLFATTSDPKMKSALRSAGFQQRGCEWKGRRGDLISLWLKE